MGLSPLPSTVGRFDWKAMRSGTIRYWQLGWALLAEQTKRLAVDGIVPPVSFRDDGSRWTPAVDLGLDYPSTSAWFDEPYVPARDVLAIASSGLRGRLVRGTIIRLESSVLDRYLEGMGMNFWSVEGGELDVPFLRSALEGRWGPAAVLADGLIVPVDHPIVGDDERADRLVRDLQDITRTFRVANDLPADGDVPPRIASGSGLADRS